MVNFKRIGFVKQGLKPKIVFCAQNEKEQIKITELWPVSFI